eukprot:gene35470-33624_t
MCAGAPTGSGGDGAPPPDRCITDATVGSRAATFAG